MLVDDIISTGRTMAEAARLVATHTSKRPVCIAVHGLFADNSDQLLVASGARVVTSNTVTHPSNALDVAPLLAASVGELAKEPPRT